MDYNDMVTSEHDKTVICPYNKAHVVLEFRFTNHLVKCRKSYTGEELETCPFNVSHKVPKPEFYYHRQTCSDRNLVLGYLQCEKKEKKKIVDWDDEEDEEEEEVKKKEIKKVRSSSPTPSTSTGITHGYYDVEDELRNSRTNSKDKTHNDHPVPHNIYEFEHHISSSINSKKYPENYQNSPSPPKPCDKSSHENISYESDVRSNSRNENSYNRHNREGSSSSFGSQSSRNFHKCNSRSPRSRGDENSLYSPMSDRQSPYVPKIHSITPQSRSRTPQSRSRSPIGRNNSSRRSESRGYRQEHGSYRSSSQYRRSESENSPTENNRSSRHFSSNRRVSRESDSSATSRVSSKSHEYYENRRPERNFEERRESYERESSRSRYNEAVEEEMQANTENFELRSSYEPQEKVEESVTIKREPVDEPVEAILSNFIPKPRKEISDWSDDEEELPLTANIKTEPDETKENFMDAVKLSKTSSNKKPVDDWDSDDSDATEVIPNFYHKEVKNEPIKKEVKDWDDDDVDDEENYQSLAKTVHNSLKNSFRDSPKASNRAVNSRFSNYAKSSSRTNQATRSRERSCYDENFSHPTKKSSKIKKVYSERLTDEEILEKFRDITGKNSNDVEFRDVYHDIQYKEMMKNSTTKLFYH